MNQIDWTGNSSEQTRESWFYVDVYEISDTDPADAVAVKVNNQYHIARAQQFVLSCGIMVSTDFR